MERCPNISWPRWLWQFIGEKEAQFQQRFPSLNYRRSQETRDIWEYNIAEYVDGINQIMHFINTNRFGTSYGSWEYPDDPTTPWFPTGAPVVDPHYHPGAPPPRSRI